MSNIIKISEAASLALHAMAYLTKNQEKMFSTKEIAKSLKVSEAKLSKVIGRLAKSGLVRSSEGPKGGAMPAKPCSQITLLDIYESIEGPLLEENCLFETPVCNGDKCILENLIHSLNKKWRDHLGGTKLSELAGVYGKKSESKKKHTENRRSEP